MRIDVSSDRLPELAEEAKLAGCEHATDSAVAVARSRVLDHLAAFDEAPQYIDPLVDALIARAGQRCRVHHDMNLAEEALNEVENDLTSWALFVLGPERVGMESAVLVARAAYRACGGAARWPGVLLRYDLPDEFLDAMRTAAPPPTPPERRGRMVTQPLESWSPLPVATPRLWNRLISVFAGTSRI